MQIFINILEFKCIFLQNSTESIKVYPFILSRDSNNIPVIQIRQSNFILKKEEHALFDKVHVLYNYYSFAKPAIPIAPGPPCVVITPPH